MYAGNLPGPACSEGAQYQHKPSVHVSRLPATNLPAAHQGLTMRRRLQLQDVATFTPQKGRNSSVEEARAEGGNAATAETLKAAAAAYPPKRVCKSQRAAS